MCVHRESGAQRAVKVLRKSHMDEDEKRMLFNEINILKEIVSPSDLLTSKQSPYPPWKLLGVGVKHSQFQKINYKPRVPRPINI